MGVSPLEDFLIILKNVKVYYERLIRGVCAEFIELVKFRA